MSFNGTGTFNINTSGQPVVTGTTISSTVFNALTADLANGLTNTLTKDGQSTPTNNIKMGGFKLTGLGTATTAGDALSFGSDITTGNLAYTGTLTGGTGIIAIGTNQFYKDASGNIGIGTATPGALLNVVSAASTDAMRVTNTGTGNSFVVEDSANPDSTAFVIDAGGSVGIGVTVPYTYGAGYVTLQANGTAGGVFRTTSGGTTVVGDFYADSTNVLIVRASTNTPMAFSTNNIERMRIDAAGNLGIGNTPSGTYKLEVTGAASFSSTALISGITTMGADGLFTAAYAPTSVRSIGYRGVPQVGGASKTANYTLALVDSGHHVYLTGSTASQTVTIPANASVAFPIGTTISIVNGASVAWSVAVTADTLTLAGGTTGGAGVSRTLAVGAVATIIKVTATAWYISGAGVS
jgi:hypothetical protein